MTPKEKAKELFEKMYNVDDPMGNYQMCFDTAKQCALITVEEIIEMIKRTIPNSPAQYQWQQVKQEIQAL